MANIESTPTANEAIQAYYDPIEYLSMATDSLITPDEYRYQDWVGENPTREASLDMARYLASRPTAVDENFAGWQAKDQALYDAYTTPRHIPLASAADLDALRRREQSLDFLRAKYVSTSVSRRGLIRRREGGKLTAAKNSYEIGLGEAGKAALVILQKQGYDHQEIRQLALFGREIEKARFTNSVREVVGQVADFRTKRNDEILGRNKPEKSLMPELEYPKRANRILPPIHDRYPSLTRAEISSERRRKQEIAASIGIL